MPPTTPTDPRPLVESPVTDQSALSFKTGAGALYFDVDFTDVTDAMTMYEFAKKCLEAEEAGKKLGATDGGWTVVLTPLIAETSTDDVPAPVFGLTQRHVGWEAATMSGTAQEFDINKFKYTMLGATKGDDGGTEFRVQTGMPERREAILVTALRNGDLMVYRLTGIIPTEGLNVTTVSANAGSFTVSLSGSVTSLEEMRAGVAPLKIYQFGPTGQKVVTLQQASQLSASAFAPMMAAATEQLQAAQANVNAVQLQINAEQAQLAADQMAKAAASASAPANTATRKNLKTGD